MGKKVLCLWQDWDNKIQEKSPWFDFWFDTMDGAYDPKNEYVIFCLSTERRVIKYKKNITIIKHKSTPIKQLLFHPWIGEELFSVIKFEKPDVIYSPYLYMLSYLPKNRVKTIGFVRDKTAEMVKAKGGWRSILGNLFYILDRVAIKKADILCHNGETMAAYAKSLGFSKKLAYCPRPIADKQLFTKAKPIKKWTKKTVVLSVARLTPEKNIELGIKALSILPTNFVYVVVGEGDHKKTLLELAKRNGVEKRVFFQGRVEHTNIWQYYKRADFFWLLSKTDFEGTPNALVEALFSKTRSIVSPIAAMRNIVEDDRAILQKYCAAELAARTLNYTAEIEDMHYYMMQKIKQRKKVKEFF